jgi:hypothetical protein
MPGDAALTHWLAGVSGVRTFDEGVMIPTLRAEDETSVKTRRL